ncbi:MAG: hypothetical protein V2A71_01720 [Candidatus Eisenbacteria bacterium]
MPQKTLLATLVGITLFTSMAFCDLCWNNVTPQNIVGFDFEITSTVQGPSKAGVYTYTYEVYRIDNGLARYRDPSHISFWLPCGLNAQRGIMSGIQGIEMTCSRGHCPVLEMGGTKGMTEPVLAPGCRFFWGFKFDQCVDPSKHFLQPNADALSYPFDPYDPYCVLVVRSSSGPEWGAWIVKGGDGKSGLYDAGYIKVPTCVPAVATGDVTWGSIKVLYH